MKSLNNYISEGIYGNLGIDTAIEKEARRDWVVNSYCPSIGLDPEEIIFRDEDEIPIIPAIAKIGMKFQINTNPEYDVAPNGMLPEYCKQILFTLFMRDVDSHIDVYSDKRNPLKSFKNLPNILNTDKENIVVSVNLNGNYDTLDFRDIKSNIVLTINKGVTVKRISNIAHCSELIFKDFTDLADISAVLNSFNNCKFTAKQIYINTPSSIKIKTTPQSLSDCVTLVQKLGLYYPINYAVKTTIRPIFSEAGVKLNNNSGCLYFDVFSYQNMSFEFLKYIDPAKIQFISLNDYRSNHNGLIIPEDDLKSLPRGVMISIPWDPSMTSELAYYEGLQDKLGAAAFPDDSFLGHIYFMKK